MKSKSEFLANNLKVLRKRARMSQEEFASELGVKRSNIAAYESKNVEPKLTILISIARFFDIDIVDLLQKDLNHDSDYSKFSDGTDGSYHQDSQEIFQINQEIMMSFVEKSAQIRKILSGFKAFYEFRKNRLSTNPETQKLLFDIDNFIEVMEHMLSSNEDIIKTFEGNNLIQNEVKSLT